MTTPDLFALKITLEAYRQRGFIVHWFDGVFCLFCYDLGAIQLCCHLLPKVFLSSFATWLTVSEAFLLAYIYTKQSCDLLSLTYSFRPAGTQPAQVYAGKCSATALTRSAKGCLLSATARLVSSAKPLCSFSDCYDFQKKDGKHDVINQVAPPASPSQTNISPEPLHCPCCSSCHNHRLCLTCK